MARTAFDPYLLNNYAKWNSRIPQHTKETLVEIKIAKKKYSVGRTEQNELLVLELGTLLGKGSFGSVHHAILKKISTERVTKSVNAAKIGTHTALSLEAIYHGIFSKSDMIAANATRFERKKNQWDFRSSTHFRLI